MKKVTVLCLETEQEAALHQLQELGILHLVPIQPPAGEALEAARLHFQHVRRALEVLDPAAADATPGGRDADETVEEIWRVLRGRKEDEDALGALRHEEQRLAPFGSFDPDEISRLRGQGVSIRLFQAPPNDVVSLPAGAVRIELGQDKAALYFALVEKISQGETPAVLADAQELKLPERSLQAFREDIARTEARLAEGEKKLLEHSRDYARIARIVTQAEERVEFLEARQGMKGAEAIVWLQGFCPSKTLDAVLEEAKRHGWGVRAQDPDPEDLVPTLLSPPALFRPILRLFDFLGISPAYTEADISTAFFVFFTIFFAMLIGDAGYGALMLLATLWMRHKKPEAPRDIFKLFSVFSLATIGWGVLSGTYFGILPAALPPLLNHEAARWLAVQNNIMLVCFALGALHMSLGHLWNAIVLFPDSRFLAQVGWCGVVWTMFCAACAVVGIFAFPGIMYGVAGSSVVLIALFMLKRSELKTKGIDLGMLPLSIIGTLGDIISYVRLFAVATASVKLAETFNGMAVGLNLPWAAKIPAMVLILLLGHGLNLMMGGLGILVHAVRLNTLEFSNHKGISWSGFAYRPFRRRLPAS
ncbi:MAG: hypothetical protein U1E27_08870 [Kiritimatiellia bacterium]|nr:hypothetical protein [Kiritimatiellia bacterium]